MFRVIMNELKFDLSDCFVLINAPYNLVRLMYENRPIQLILCLIIRKIQYIQVWEDLLNSSYSSTIVWYLDQNK